MAPTCMPGLLGASGDKGARCHISHHIPPNLMLLLHSLRHNRALLRCCCRFLLLLRWLLWLLCWLLRLRLLRLLQLVRLLLGFRRALQVCQKSRHTLRMLAIAAGGSATCSSMSGDNDVKQTRSRETVKFALKGNVKGKQARRQASRRALLRQDCLPPAVTKAPGAKSAITSPSSSSGGCCCSSPCAACCGWWACGGACACACACACCACSCCCCWKGCGCWGGCRPCW